MAPSTKLALANALKAQLQKKFLDDITVKELVEACEINRQTFYYHFQDIYDLLRWLLEHETGETLGGAEDPAAAAELYGGLHALVWTGMPALEKLVVIRDPGIHLGIDFDAQETRAEGELGISIRLGTLIAVGTQLAVPAIGWLRRFMKRRRMPPASKAADNKAAEHPAA